MTIKYCVFNTLTGNHEHFDSEEEARDEIVRISKAILDYHYPDKLSYVVIDENGGETHSAYTLTNDVIVS
jgi:hypothetical protein